MTSRTGKLPPLPIVIFVVVLALAVVSHPQVDVPAPVTQVHPISDPEVESEFWDDYVWADSLDEARRKCAKLAEDASEGGKYSVKVVQVKQVGSGKKYWCQFETQGV